MKITGRINRTTFHYEADTNGVFVKHNGRVRVFVKFNRYTVGVSVWAFLMGSLSTFLAF